MARCELRLLYGGGGQTVATKKQKNTNKAPLFQIQEVKQMQYKTQWSIWEKLIVRFSATVLMLPMLIAGAWIIWDKLLSELNINLTATIPVMQVIVVVLMFMVGLILMIASIVRSR